jgi:hypothetical protein
MSEQDLSDTEREKLEERLRIYADVMKSAPKEPPFFLSDVESGGEILFLPGDAKAVGVRTARPESVLTLPAGVEVRLAEQSDGTWRATAMTSHPEHSAGRVRLLLSGLPTREATDDVEAVITGKIVLSVTPPYEATYNFGRVEDALGVGYRGFSWSAVFVPARCQTVTVPPPFPRVAICDPEQLAFEVVEELRFTSFVPPSELLTRELRQKLREEAEASVADRLPDVQSRRLFLVACAKEIRKVRRTCAEVTGKSGVQSRELDAAKLIVRLTCQDHVLSEYEADEDLCEPAIWFRLSEDAAMETDDIATLFSAEPYEVSSALNEFRSQVEIRQKSQSSDLAG